MKTYDLYFPLGGACACTQILRYSKLQFASYPFDWLIGASITDRASILVNQFTDFLREKAMECIKEDNRPNGKDTWRNNDNGLLFMHDFNHGTSFAEAYSGICEKYQRRARRLIQQITTSKRVLAVYAERPCDPGILGKKQLSEALQILRDAFPTVHIDMLYLYNDDSVLISDAQETQVCEGVSEIRYCYSLFNIYAPYEVNLPMAAAALNHFAISGLQVSDDCVRARMDFVTKAPDARELTRRHNLGLKFTRYIMHYEGYFHKAHLFHSLIRHFYPKIK